MFMMSKICSQALLLENTPETPSEDGIINIKYDNNTLTITHK